MPTVQQNLEHWSTYAWPAGGDEWSAGAGGTPYVWHGTIFPRLCRFLPCRHVLEIAPGHGRLSAYLVPLCKRLTLVDLVPECVDACRKRFAAHRHVRCHVNDGTSLDMVKDADVDFVFSWDSLVHAEQDVIAAYLDQLARKLRPGAFGLFSHSNIGTYADPGTGRLTIENTHWRAESMTAERFRDLCDHAGLWCLAQEVRTMGGPELIDCISLFMRPQRTGPPPETNVMVNREFWRETHNLRRISTMYAPPPGAG